MESAGAAYIFERLGNGNWTEVQKIVASDRRPTDYFGGGVAINGTIALIGALSRDEAPPSGGSLMSSMGAAYIFERDNSGNWVETQKLLSSDREEFDRFGGAVALSKDYIIIGADSEDHDLSGGSYKKSSGSAYIFEKDGTGTWVEVQKVVASDRSIDDRFGNQVAIDGDFAIIGTASNGTDVSGGNFLKDAGAAYIFHRDVNGTWKEVQKLVANDRAPEDFFGWHVSISGGNAFVGAVGEDEDVSGGNSKHLSGSTYMFELSTSQGIFPLNFPSPFSLHPLPQPHHKRGHPQSRSALSGCYAHRSQPARAACPHRNPC